MSTVAQLTLEIRNLAHRGWEDREPMKKIQADAKADGLKVDGMMANELCKDANWLRDKARAAVGRQKEEGIA